MASGEWERPSGADEAPDEKPASVPPLHTAERNPYEATVERLLALLEENQIAITALAKAWRHTSRDLELTKVQLEAAERRLAAETLKHRKAAG